MKELTQEANAAQEEKSKIIQALEKYFEPSEIVTAQHELYSQFAEQHGKIINKFWMYVSFQTGWGNPTGKDANGNLGYHMKVKLSVKGDKGNG